MAFVVMTHRDEVKEIEIAPSLRMGVVDLFDQMCEEFPDEKLGLNGIQFIQDAVHLYGQGAREVVFVDVHPTVENPEELVENTVGFIAHLHTKRTAEQMKQMPALQ